MPRILSLANTIRNTRKSLTQRNALIILFSLSVMTSASATFEPTAPVNGVHEFTLENGLKILVKPDNRAPIAVSQMWYKVGSSYEHGGITGVSHALEHMMFKGTKQYPNGEFDRIVTENGAESNAFTTQDATTYYQVMANDRLATFLELEADRMQGLTLLPEEVEKELKVIQEERRLRVEDNPNALAYEQFNAIAFNNSPYQYPVIGWMNDIENLSLADLRAWYQQWYAPNNAILVVAGDVDPQAVLKLAQQYFGKLAPSQLAVPKPQVEAPQTGKRYAQVKATAKVPLLVMGYKTPTLLTAKVKWEPYALSVLSSILAGGDSSRLDSELVRGKALAAYASASFNPFGRLGEHFSLLGVPAKDITIASLQSALLAQVERVRNEPVTQKELDRVKAQVIAGEVYKRDSVQHQAFTLGKLESVGLGYQLMDNYVKNISAITSEQVQQVAKKYLLEDQLTIVELIPQQMGDSNADSSKE